MRMLNVSSIVTRFSDARKAFHYSLNNFIQQSIKKLGQLTDPCLFQSISFQKSVCHWYNCLGFCYKLIAEEYTFAEAMKQCATYDKGVIGYPHSQADMEFFMTMGLGESFWLGVTSNEEGKSWIDSDGKFYNGFVSPLHIITSTS